MKEAQEEVKKRKKKSEIAEEEVKAEVVSKKKATKKEVEVKSEEEKNNNDEGKQMLIHHACLIFKLYSENFPEEPLTISVLPTGVLGEIMKKEIINEKKNHPEKFINIEEAIKNPTVVHNTLCYPKLWSIDAAYQTMYTNCGERHNCSCKRDFDIWHSFARQTDYYDEIVKFTGVYKQN